MDFRSVLNELIKSRERVLVVGLGVSGVETAKFLMRLGAGVVCVEKQSEGEYFRRTKFEATLRDLRAAGAALYFGVEGEGVKPFLDRVKLAVFSPGVPQESAIAGALRRAKIPIVSELELGVSLSGRVPVVVSGSNGKSTTVTLIHQMLSAGGFSSLLCGNIGVPVVSDLGRAELDGPDWARNHFLVVEASSYQLEGCRVLKPKIAVLLNISDNHLERHGTIERYLEAKAQMFGAQDESDFALLNIDDPRVRNLSGKITAKVVGFGRNLSLGDFDYGALIRYDPRYKIDRIELRLLDRSEEYELSVSCLIGLHNRYNLAVAILVARLTGVSEMVVRDVIQKFRPLPHRLEQLRQIPAPLIINDSKATTVAATLAAVEAVVARFEGRRLTLLLGGLAKAGSWEPLLKLLGSLEARLNEVVCFGQDGRIVANHCETRGIRHRLVPTLAAAVPEALSLSSTDGIVLFSPGCASFDEFSDFEERGNMFKSWVSQVFSAQSNVSRECKS